MKRLHLIISGFVQDVGYRAWVKREAEDLKLRGWVRNRDDGTVELVVEGNLKQLEKLIKQCWIGPEVCEVKQVHVVWQTATGEFTTFEILH